MKKLMPFVINVGKIFYIFGSKVDTCMHLMSNCHYPQSITQAFSVKHPYMSPVRGKLIKY